MKTDLRHYVLLITLCITGTLAYAQADSVMQGVTLGDVEIKVTRHTLKLKSQANGHSVLDMRILESLPQILGHADPIHYSQTLPEIQTNGEYRGGINIQGCESSHNLVSIGSIPVYNPSHLLEFFSTFNASHYDKCNIDRFSDAKSENRLGGELSMELPYYEGDTLSAEFSVGMISSQGTVRLPLGRKTFCKASFRATYINLLYGRWLNDEDTDIDYSFYDMNLTLSHVFNEKNSVVIDYYGGQDNGAFTSGSYTAKMLAKWGNHLAGVHHNYNNGKGLLASNNLYLTSYRNLFQFNMQDAEFVLPSSILDFGLKHQAVLDNLKWGGDFTYHHIRPQSLQSKGTIVTDDAAGHVSNTVEMSAYVTYKQPLSKSAHLEAGVRGSLYGSKATKYFVNADPSLTFNYNDKHVEVFAGYALKHQYLFQTGFSDAGLPTEFWLPSDKDFTPQYSHSFNAGASVSLFSKRYKVAANLFFKKLYSQIEYVGSIFDFVNSKYELRDHLQQGKGQNYGFSVMLNKCSSRLTGWVAYTYTHARREFNSGKLTGSYPANHERPHELNAVVTYNLGKHWNFGSTFVYASGTPFTAADYFALINGNIISHFRQHNSNRLRPYYRWDVSASYKWKPKFAKENGFNLSIYNMTGHDNEMFYYMSIDKDWSYSYKAKSFIVDILPSISYFCKF